MNCGTGVYAEYRDYIGVNVISNLNLWIMPNEDPIVKLQIKRNQGKWSGHALSHPENSAREAIFRNPHNVKRKFSVEATTISYNKMQFLFLEQWRNFFRSSDNIHDKKYR